MSQRFRGRSYASLLRKLPRNLIVFDGHCLMCQARAQFILERNFSFFDFLDTTQSIDVEKLNQNKILFCSFDSVDGREIRRNFASIAKDAEAVVLVETVPSQSAAFLSSVRQNHKKKNSKDCGLFAEPLLSAANKVDDMDILVSVKFTAVCRIGMKLDRTLLRLLSRCLYYLVPQRIGDMWFDRVLARRRLWGTSEEDAVRFPKRVLGIKERTWRLREG